MKRIIISILVLGMGTWAGADVLFNIGGTLVPDGGVIEIPVGTVFELQIFNTYEDWTWPFGLGGVAVDLTCAEIAGSPIAYNENLSGTWSIEEEGFDSGLYWWLIQWVIPAPGFNPPGLAPLFGIPLQCTAEGPVTVIVYNSNYDEILRSMTINQVPEPATLTLLAAGGLLLRRSFRAG